MSIQDSYLVQPKYGYDMVVAVTQKALNNTIKEYYATVAASKTPFTLQTCYFVKDAAGNPAAIDKASLLALTNNIDPLTVASGQTDDINALVKSTFYFAFQFEPGDPTGTNKFTYLTLNPGANSVIYYLLCTTIKIAFWNPDAQTWINVTQTRANEFNINANIDLQNVLDNSNLPPAVQAEVDNLGTTDVNVQQLIFDFDSSVVNPTTALPGLDSSSSVFKPLMQQFATAYFNAYAAAWVPVLNYALTQNNASSLIPTRMDLYIDAINNAQGDPVTVDPTISQSDLSTLNYLFSVNGDALPAAGQLNWNWLEDNGVSPTPDLDPNADVNLYSGAIAIKRDAFARYFASQLDQYVALNCFSPTVLCQPQPSPVDDTFLASFFPIDVSQLADPFQPYSPFNGPGSDQLLMYWFNQSASAKGTVWAGDYMDVTVHFVLTLSVQGTTLTIYQDLWLLLNATINRVPYAGAPIKKTYTDVFDLVVDDSGNIAFQVNAAQRSVLDQSVPVTLPYEQGQSLTDYINSLSVQSFTQVPITMPKQFVFPGGNAFTFKDAQFSDYSDLVCHVTYLKES